MIGGLMIATLLTLIFLPALYAAWYRAPVPSAEMTRQASPAMAH